jgi:uncharacterized RDD family membrane protein YckC
MANVVTGDAVVLDVSTAAFPARMTARLIDMAVEITALVIALVTISKSAGSLNSAAVAALVTVTFVLVIVGYPTIFETLSRGKTLGKMALGLRVVSDDGGPERFRQALIRALAAIFEIWVIPLCPIALVASIISAKGKRVGDMFAGTYVISERVPQRRNLRPEFAFVPPPLAGWAQQLELSRLSDQEAEAASSYLRRFYDLHPAARDALGMQLAAAVAAKVSPPPPPGTPPAAYLAAVLAVRRDRDFARYAAQAGQQPYAGPQPDAPGTAPWFSPPSAAPASSPAAEVGPPADSGQPAHASVTRGPGQPAPAEPGQPGYAPPT